MARVVIVDDHQLVAESLRMALEARDIPACIAAPRDLAELRNDVLAENPELVLLDLDLGAVGDATPLIAPLTQSGVRVLVVSGLADRLRMAAALEQGAVGYRGKTDGLELLVNTAAAALAGPVPLDIPARMALLEELRRERHRLSGLRTPFERLTDREGDVLRCMAQGFAVSDIATDWVVSEATVRSHVHGVLRKLGVRSQLAAVAAALRVGWLDTSRLSEAPSPASYGGDSAARESADAAATHLRRPA